MVQNIKLYYEKEKEMRLVFPTDEDMGYLSKRGAHFGKAKYYTIITLKGTKISDVECVENQGHKSGACGNAVSNIMNLNPDALIVSGIGNSPAQGFAQAGLDLYFDQSSPTVKASVEMFVAGKLEKNRGNGTCSTH
jgi:predicted Fe-Mo cluster-binding NifX family protein